MLDLNPRSARAWTTCARRFLALDWRMGQREYHWLCGGGAEWGSEWCGIGVDFCLLPCPPTRAFVIPFALIYQPVYRPAQYAMYPNSAFEYFGGGLILLTDKLNKRPLSLHKLQY
jgi:hypothetical protein